MDIYLVGGAVRDALLGRPVKERDWVVVGATAEDMLAQGYRPVGKDFPVFLHPDTHEEYALARTERKTAPGYHGFVFHADPDVTLEQDLERRDLTINAMAQAPDGRIIDPFHGQADLEKRLLRHVSPAFQEDPVRILRLARFAARYAPLGFRVAEQTRDLARAMAAAGEVDALVPERVWQETVRALGEDSPSTYIRVLRDCRCLKVLFPEIDALFGVPQPEKYHPEIDTGEHTLLALDMAASLSAESTVRFAALMHDLGKARTPEKHWPSHRGHEEAGVAPIQALCRRLRAPKEHEQLAILAARWHLHIHRAAELRPATVLKVLEATDAFRRPERFENLLTVCESDARGRTGLEQREYPQRALFQRYREAAAGVDARPFVDQGLRGDQIATALRKARTGAIEAAAPSG